MWPNRFPKWFASGPAVLVLGLGAALISRWLPSVGAGWTTGLAALAALAVGIALGPLLSRGRSRGSFDSPVGVPGEEPVFVTDEPFVDWELANRRERWQVVYVWGDPGRIVLGLRPAGRTGPWPPVRWLRMHRDGRDEAAWRGWQRWRVAVQRRR